MKLIIILFIISTLCILLQQLQIARLFAKQKHSSFADKTNAYPVSVVICAKNEASNLSKNLLFILEQDYPKFEVIVVNDHSSDSTAEVVKEFQNRFTNLRLIHNTSKKSNSKRDALKSGIKASSFEIVLMTDADCRPVSNQWILNMAAQLDESKSCVLGYSPYIYHSSFLNWIIQFETLQTASLYISRAIKNKAYMSVGRNVMYSKELFLKSENFENEKHLTSGDDDLLIQNIRDKSQITVCTEPDSFVFSLPKNSWGSWWKQKLRHYSTAIHYDFRSQLFLGIYHFFHVLFWLCFLILLFSEFSTTASTIFILALLLKSFLIVVYGKVLKVPRPVLLVWPILEASLLIMQMALGLLSKFKNQKTW